MINISGLKKSYQETSVIDVETLTIAAGECFGLVGNNGAGKTTLFRMILDLVKPTAGTITIDGQSVSRSGDWKRYVGSYLDEGFLISYLTPDEYLQFVGRLHHYSDEDLSVFLACFEEFFNGEILGRKTYISALSKGNMKKVGIVAAFIGNPRMVILDEPFENLDPTSQIRLKRFLKEKQEERKTTCLISSHDLNHVTEISDRIVILEKGKVIRDIDKTEDTLVQLTDYFNVG